MKKIAIISLSNGLKDSTSIDLLTDKLKSININVVKSSSLYSYNGLGSLSPKMRAKELENLFLNPEIECIFDVSGGGLANEVLSFLNFDIIRNNQKPFFGYSDLSVINNALYKKCQLNCIVYQLRNIINDKTNKSFSELKDYLFNKNTDLLNFNYKFLRGEKMNGIVVGGNLRCTLKLAGTEFLPDFNDKLLFIESMGGSSSKIITYLTQYKLMGVFDKINGIILGNFTEMEENKLRPSVEDIALSIVPNNIPIIKTQQLGHYADSKAIILGKYYEL